MKVAVINYSGSVGKTLISSYLLAPRLTGANSMRLKLSTSLLPIWGLRMFPFLKVMTFHG
nr:StbB protein [uncultured bacterium]